MKILITGGAGFQGSHLAEKLIDEGHGVAILNTPSALADRNIESIESKVKLIWGSITDEELVRKAVRGQDVVYHLAAHVNVDESREHPERTISTNVLGSVNVLEAVRQNGSRLILASSCEVYGDGHKKGVLREDSELRPNSPYAASKAAVDRIAYSYTKTFGTKLVIVRPFNIFGERQKAGKFGALIPIFVSRALEGKNLTVFGRGTQERDYVYISDIVDAFSLVLKNKSLDGRVVNFSTGKSTKIIDIARYIAKKLNVGIDYLEPRPGEVSKFIGNNSLARSMNWKPKVSVYEGIDRYIEWAKSQNLNV